MICIYHRMDADGWSSASIVKRWHDQKNDGTELKLIGYQYKEPVPYDLIPAGEPIIMVDVCLDSMEDMLKLAKHSNNQMTWIDHHASSIKDYKEFIQEHGEFLTAVLKDGISACEGTWNYLFPDTKMPLAIQLLGEYDTWRNQDKHRWDNVILPFQFGMRLYCTSAETFPVHLFEDVARDVDSIIKEGVTVLKYQGIVNKTQCSEASFEMNFEGLRAICVNVGLFNSDVFKSVYDESKHDIMIPFQFNGKSWRVSLYSTKPEIDCSVIAKKYKGGGHKQASGMELTDISTIFPMIK